MSVFFKSAAKIIKRFYLRGTEILNKKAGEFFHRLHDICRVRIFVLNILLDKMRAFFSVSYHDIKIVDWSTFYEEFYEHRQI